MDRNDNLQQSRMQSEVDKQIEVYKSASRFVVSTVKYCYSSCVHDFTINYLLPQEKQCLDTCISRQIKARASLDLVLPS